MVTFAMSPRNWREAAGALTEDLEGLFAKSETLLLELAKLWQAPELAPEDTSARATAVGTKLASIVEEEGEWLQKTRRKLENSIEEVATLAHEIGEAPAPRSEKASIAEQHAALKKDKKRLFAIADRQAEEIKEVMQKVSRECERLGVDMALYSLDSQVVGAAALRSANHQLQKLDKLMKERVDLVLAQRARIRALSDQLGESLEFRLALPGELPGSDGGVVVLEKNEDNEQFVQDFLEFKVPGTKDVSLFTRCMTHLKRVEETYRAQSSTRKPEKTSKSKSVSLSCSGSCSGSGSGSSSCTRSRSRARRRERRRRRKHRGRRRTGRRGDREKPRDKSASGPATEQQQQQWQLSHPSASWLPARPPLAYGHPVTGPPPLWSSPSGYPGYSMPLGYYGAASPQHPAYQPHPHYGAPASETLLYPQVPQSSLQPQATLPSTQVSQTQPDYQGWRPPSGPPADAS